MVPILVALLWLCCVSSIVAKHLNKACTSIASFLAIVASFVAATCASLSDQLCRNLARVHLEQDHVPSAYKRVRCACFLSLPLGL